MNLNGPKPSENISPIISWTYDGYLKRIHCFSSLPPTGAPKEKKFTPKNDRFHIRDVLKSKNWGGGGGTF